MSSSDRHARDNHRHSAYASMMDAIEGPLAKRLSSAGQGAPLLNQAPETKETRKETRRKSGLKRSGSNEEIQTKEKQPEKEKVHEKPSEKRASRVADLHESNLRGLSRAVSSSAQDVHTAPSPPTNSSTKEGSTKEGTPRGLSKKALDAHTMRTDLQDQLQALSLSQNMEEVTYKSNPGSKDGSGLMKRQRLSVALSESGNHTPSTSSPTNQKHKSKVKLARSTSKDERDEDRGTKSMEFDEDTEEHDQVAWMQWLLHVHEKAICVVISANCMTMGLEMDYPWNGWFWVNQVMLAAYVVDIALRIYAQSCRDFVRGGWNWLDSIIVISSILDMWIIPFVHVSGKKHNSRSIIGSVTIILRLPRLLRIFRILTVVKAVRPLYNLLVGLSEAFSAIFWFLVLVCVLLYAFALIFHQMFSHGWEALSEDANDDAKQVFATVMKSFFSLFRVMAADMTDLGPILSHCMDWSLPMWYMAFQMCSSWLLLSTLTATVIDTVLGSKAKREREEEFRRVRDERDQVTEALQDALGELANVYDELRVDELREFLEDPENADLLRKLVNKEPFEALQDWEALQIEGAVQLDDFIEHLQAGSYSHNVAGNVHRLESRVLRLQSSMDQVIAFLPVLRNLSDRVQGGGVMPMAKTASGAAAAVDSDGDPEVRRDSRLLLPRSSIEGDPFTFGKTQSERRKQGFQGPRILMPLTSQAESDHETKTDESEHEDTNEEEALMPVRRAAITHTTLMSPRILKAATEANTILGHPRGSMGVPEGRLPSPKGSRDMSPKGSREVSPRGSPRDDDSSSLTNQQSNLPSDVFTSEAGPQSITPPASSSRVPRSPQAKASPSAQGKPPPSPRPQAKDAKATPSPQDQDKFKELHLGIDDLRRELNEKVDDLRRNLLDALNARGVGIGLQPIETAKEATQAEAVKAPKEGKRHEADVDTLKPHAQHAGQVVNFQELSNSIAKAVRDGLAASAGGPSAAAGGPPAAAGGPSAAAGGPSAAAGAPATTSFNFTGATTVGIDALKEMDLITLSPDGDQRGSGVLSSPAAGASAAAAAENSASPGSATGMWLPGRHESGNSSPAVMVPQLTLAQPSSHGDAAGGMTPTAVREPRSQNRSTRSPVVRGRSPAHSSSATHSPQPSARS